jgi:uncharacterized tellurite resistance protein B-like protein
MTMDPSEIAAMPGPLGPLTPSQRALLRLVCWVALADGDFAEQERQLLSQLVARLLSQSADQAEQTVQALAQEQIQAPDPQALVADLEHRDQRQLAVKLAFQMACINQRASDAALFNTAEKRAYRRLVELLALPETEVAEAEWAARQDLTSRRSLPELIRAALVDFGAWPALEGDSLPPGYWL